MGSYLKKRFMKFTSKERLKEGVQLLFLQRLHYLLSMGYSILDALEVMKWDESLKPICEKVIVHLRKGMRIDKALEKANFHESVVAYLYFVSVNGNLLFSLEKCIMMFEHRMTYVTKFSRMIRYPIVLMIFFTILLIFLKQSVLPTFIELFRMSKDSSHTVLFSLLFIDLFTMIIFTILGIILISFLVWNKIKHNIPIENKIKLYQKIPIYRTFLTMQTSYYFSTHLSMFLKAGMSLKDILKSISKQDKLPIIRYYANLMMEQLSQGRRVDHLLMALPLIEKQLGYIFQKNEDAHSLERDLIAYSNYIADQIERKVMRMIHFVQPTFFTILALFIIFIYVSLMWPMFQVIKTI